MSKYDGKMYIASRLVKSAETNVGPVQIAEGQCAGVLFVFWTKTAAREVYGRNVVLVEIKAEDQDNE